MIDTIVLTLEEGEYFINDPDKFEPSARWVLRENASMGGRGYVTSKQNPTKSELKAGIYKPRLTLTNRFNHVGKREATLKIELSLPKLLFGNNFDEFQLNDFGAVLEKLQLMLKEMGVKVFEHKLRKVLVSSVHYSKNIPLTDGSTPYHYISKIKETNVTLTLDVNQTDYRNDGYSYKWHCNQYEVAFYDKLKDLEKAKKSGKRAIEKDNAIQLGLFDNLKMQKKFEVFRMEVRLNKRVKIKGLLKILGIQTEPTFENLFNPSIAQKVLLYYLNELERQRLVIIDYKPANAKELLSNLIINNPRLGIKRTLQMFGLKQAFATINPRELRQMFGKYSPRSWYRLISDTKKLELPKTKSQFTVIREHLTAFKPLKLIDFQDEMINNDKYN